MNSDIYLYDLYDHVTDYMIYAYEASSVLELKAYHYKAVMELDAYFKLLEDTFDEIL